MNIAPERAREACESCRKSHKKCTYDNNSTRCLRCEKRNTLCSLFLSVETTATAQQGPPPLVTVGSAPDSWAELGTPHGSSASSNFSYQFPPPEDYYWANPAFTGNTQGEYPADTIYQVSANQHESEQAGVNQAGLYGHNNVFSGHDGT
ncbi:hypothetical protein L210DRAFT_976645 [Boletus edulis BED1]|uniref:Zn(2)-C6 fungal-type domain-containing protein n=1 Tax=Boletus edulis BED1 TaxID=1328754 RepID=A0AAD4C6I9_BOLED|nr:hypothetical protein L210DRAFT_976645 [Boletus edulis BED1]